ncbi:MAG: hypothetical protein OQJ99_10395 [Rhodospirillales bacterium]|nr:hypothetical protein [Rhodospirillales bacterium]MCW8862056.1 hypothetical protein [Rhodospirillales bacterium]MCW8951385.1 hypothetical protein [Rhodospirillales bacterium]MCW8971385.1 hypothetical protein [Rhodospirillales bacterium]MCW9002348.1 hypothetical protein [Rhodospirillales bacterium]
MATEVRRLIFTETETSAILSAYLATGSSTMPRGIVMDFKIVKEDPFTIRVLIQASDGRQLNEIMEEVHVTAAMINFCMQSRIPLSRKAKKRVKKLNSGIALDMVMGKV